VPVFPSPSPSPSPSPARSAGPATAPANERILAAARALMARGGAAEISIGDVAANASVSKALVHYHFHDKDSLLVALAEQTGQAAIARAGAALRSTSDEHVLDAYWRAIEDELRAGDLRILLALAEYDSDRLRLVCRRFAAERRDLTSEQISAIFAHLGLTLRVPAQLVADTVIAFTDGLALVHALEPERATRPAFDVLWLALLTLAE
jgi:AcrR family transcriptional regulator